jgi:hypothetical protein
MKDILGYQILNILNTGLCQIEDYTICGGLNLSCFLQISHSKNQISGFGD